MKLQTFIIAPSGTHHLLKDGTQAYEERFDTVLKFREPGLAAVTRNGRAWHIHTDGTPAYEKRFAKTFNFYGGWAAVQSDQQQGSYYHIKTSGQKLYTPQFNWCGNFQECYCVVRSLQDEYFHIDSTGNNIYNQKWRYVGDFRDGIAVVQDDTGLSTHIDHYGNFIHAQWFNDLDVYHKGYARALDNAGWTHINFTGRPVYKRRFAAIEPFYNGCARVQTFEGAIEIISENGETLLQTRSSTP